MPAPAPAHHFDAQPRRDLTTVSRQSYVAPINMRYMNEL